MPYYKNVQYTVYCDFCESLEDFAAFKTLSKAEKHWRTLGWSKKASEVWACPECAKTKRASHFMGFPIVHKNE